MVNLVDEVDAMDVVDENQKANTQTYGSGLGVNLNR